MHNQIAHDLVIQYEAMARGLACQIGVKGDEESTGIALMALCTGANTYAASSCNELSAEQFLKLTICNALKNYRKRVYYERKRGLSGGAASKAQIKDHPKRGKIIGADQKKSEHDMNRTIVETRDDKWQEDLQELLSILPASLRPFASQRWVDHNSLAEIAEKLGVSLKIVRTKLEKAEAYARLYLSGSTNAQV